jgi:hypothetical protein
MPASFRELLDALEFVSLDGGFGGHEAVLCRETGQIYLRSDAADLDEIPDDAEDDSEKYIAIPSRRDLDLGKPLVFDFAREFLPDDFDEVRYIFSKKGAYRKFRDLLTRRKAVDRWYDFEAKATKQALREWCELHAIAVAD